MNSLAIILLGERKESRQYFFCLTLGFFLQETESLALANSGFAPFPLLPPHSDPRWPVYVDSRH
jgi:hypothetical protein